MNSANIEGLDPEAISKAAVAWRSKGIDEAALAWREALRGARREQKANSIDSGQGIKSPCLEAVRMEFAVFLWSWGMLRPEMAQCFLDSSAGKSMETSASMALIVMSGAARLGISMSGGRPAPFDLDLSVECEEGGRTVSLRAVSKGGPCNGRDLQDAAVFFESVCSGFDARDFDLPATVEGSEAFASWDGVLELNARDMARVDWSAMSRSFDLSLEKLDLEWAARAEGLAPRRESARI